MGVWSALDLTQSGGEPQQAFDPAWRVILLDDVHRFTPAQQQTAFAWMIHAQSVGCNVVAAGPVPPVNLTLRDDVRSRLSQGQVMALHPLSEAHVREVLKSAAHARGIVLSHEVLDYVMLRFSRDLSSLHQLLDRLDTFSLEAKRGVTVPLINAMFKSMEGDA
jgi:DnaA family protein